MSIDVEDSYFELEPIGKKQSNNIEPKASTTDNLPKVPVNKDIANQIRVLQSFEDDYTQKLEFEKRRHVDLVQQLSVLRKEVKGFKDTHLNPTDTGTFNKNLMRKMRTYENRLREMNVKLNNVLTTNRQLKDSVSELRYNKTRRNRMLMKLIKKYEGKQEELNQMSTEFADIQDLKNQISGDCVTLSDTITAENQEFEDVWTAGVTALEREKEILRQQEQKLIASQTHTAICEEWVDDPLVKQYKLTNTLLFWDLAKKGNEYRKQNELVHEYRGALKQMENNSGITDYQKMIETMTEFEDANFSSVQRISNLTNEITQAETDITALRLLLSTDTDSDSTTHEKRLVLLKDIENEIQVRETQSEEYATSLDHIQATLDGLKIPMAHLFDQIGCEDEMLTKEYSVSGITDTNIVTIMGVIEERVLELAQMYSLSKRGYLEECITKMAESGHFDMESMDFDTTNRAFKGRQSMLSPKVPLKTPLLPTVSQIEEDAPLPDEGLNPDKPLSIERIKETTKQTIIKLAELNRSQSRESTSSGRFTTSQQLRMKKFLYVGPSSRPQTPRTPRGSKKPRIYSSEVESSTQLSPLVTQISEDVFPITSEVDNNFDNISELPTTSEQPSIDSLPQDNIVQSEPEPLKLEIIKPPEGPLSPTSL